MAACLPLWSTMYSWQKRSNRAASDWSAIGIFSRAFVNSLLLHCSFLHQAQAWLERQPPAAAISVVGRGQGILMALYQGLHYRRDAGQVLLGKSRRCVGFCLLGHDPSPKHSQV